MWRLQATSLGRRFANSRSVRLADLPTAGVSLLFGMLFFDIFCFKGSVMCCFRGRLDCLAIRAEVAYNYGQKLSAKHMGLSENRLSIGSHR